MLYLESSPEAEFQSLIGIKKNCDAASLVNPARGIRFQSLIGIKKNCDNGLIGQIQGIFVSIPDRD